MTMRKEMQSIRLLQQRSKRIESEHVGIQNSLEEIRASLAEFEEVAVLEASEEHRQEKQAEQSRQEARGGELEYRSFECIAAEAEAAFPYAPHIGKLLSADELIETDAKLSLWTEEFNHKHSLEAWDYAIACGCGVFAGMLDLLCVNAPVRSSVTSFDTPLNGVFNRWTQVAFNKIFPPELSAKLSSMYTIGAPDASTIRSLLDAPPKTLNPVNHRLRALSHDPILGIILGVMDMKNNTCTVITGSGITSFAGAKDAIVEPNLWSYLGRMFWHLCSDVNAPSGGGNRGMGLPAPFMGLLRMFEGIPVGDSNFGKQVEWMYVNGYDFRHFITTSIPVSVMEVLLRVFYVVKQMHLHNAPFGETLMETMPFRLSKRFRMMLALAYGTTCAINGARVCITKNILHANYAAWGGMAWNTFHSLKWLLLDRPAALSRYFEDKAVEEIRETIARIALLEERARVLPA